MNVIDYIKLNKNRTFTELPFNEIDSVIFTQLAYIPFKEIVTKEKKDLMEVAKEFFQKYEKKDIQKMVVFVRKALNLLNLIKSTKRYSSVKLFNYIKILNSAQQFGALTIEFSNGFYVAYEGTDDTIAGWIEDFKLAYQHPIPSQLLAKKYLTKVGKYAKKPIFVGGHSKGGNLAVYAAMNCNFFVKLKIKKIFNFDGPGFDKRTIKTLKYRMISKKIKRFIPNQSLIGLLLYHNDDISTIKSSKISILQHDIFNWQIKNNQFIVKKLSPYSLKIANKINDTVTTLNKKDFALFINELYEECNNLNITHTKDLLKIHRTLMLFYKIKKIDNDVKKDLSKLISFKIFF